MGKYIPPLPGKKKSTYMSQSATSMLKKGAPLNMDAVVSTLEVSQYSWDLLKPFPNDLAPLNMPARDFTFEVVHLWSSPSKEVAPANIEVMSSALDVSQGSNVEVNDAAPLNMYSCCIHCLQLDVDNSINSKNISLTRRPSTPRNRPGIGRNRKEPYFKERKVKYKQEQEH